MIVFSYVNENGIRKHATDQSLIWRGDWDSNSNYWIHDWVIWKGDFYMASGAIPPSSIPPGSSSLWFLLTQVVFDAPGASVVRVGPTGFDWTNLQLVDSVTVFVPGSIISVNGSPIFTSTIGGTTGLGVVVAIYGTVDGTVFTSPEGPEPEPTNM